MPEPSIPSAWGRGVRGNLSIAAEEITGDANYPVTAITLPYEGAQVLDACMGPLVSIFLLDDTTVYGSGEDTETGGLGQGTLGGTQVYSMIPILGPGSVGYLTGISQIAGVDPGPFFALTPGGSVYFWGGYAGFDNGLGGDDTGRGLPQILPGPGSVGVLSGIVQIACDGGVFVARDSGGTVYTMGDNVFGACGIGTEYSADTANPARYEPFPVVSLATDAAEIAAHIEGGVVLDTGGTVSAWGHNNMAQCGTLPPLITDPLYPVFGDPPHWDQNDSYPTPRVVAQAQGAVHVYAQAQNGWADMGGGTVLGWGINVYENALAGGTATGYTFTDYGSGPVLDPEELVEPTQMEPTDVLEPRGGNAYLSTEGGLWTYGQNTVLRLGFTPASDDYHAPRLVVDQADTVLRIGAQQGYVGTFDQDVPFGSHQHA